MLDAGGVLAALGDALEGLGSGGGPARTRGIGVGTGPGRPRGWPTKRRARGGN